MMISFQLKHRPVVRRLFFAICASIILLGGCRTRKEIIVSKTPAQVSKWVDKKLCSYAGYPNPAIKAELMRRELLTEVEYNDLFESGHNFFPQVGMRKCEMWAFSDDTELLSKSVESDGTVCEVWRLFVGPYMFFKSWGGYYLMITIKNDKIIGVDEVE